MKIKDHRIEEVQFKPTPNQGGKIVPEAIVIHYTSGRALMSTVRWLQNPKSSASVHIVIGRDGAVVQMVPFDVKAWHAGSSTLNGKQGCNGFTIGIELCNFGLLEYRNGMYFSSAGTTLPESDVVSAAHKFTPGKAQHWEKYTAEQIKVCVSVCETICKEYGIKTIVGHDDVAYPKGRKIDPGPAIDMSVFSAIEGVASGQVSAGIDKMVQSLMLLRDDVDIIKKRIDRLLNDRMD